MKFVLQNVKEEMIDLKQLSSGSFVRIDNLVQSAETVRNKICV